MFPLKYLETETMLIVPLPSMVTILVPQSCITLASCKNGCPSNMEYVGFIVLLFMTMKVTMYNMPWILILILGTIPKGLLNEKSTILKLNGIGWGGGNPNFRLNPSTITFTLDPPSKSTLSTMFFPTCTTIASI